MKYCPTCSSEYAVTVVTCAVCADHPVLILAGARTGPSPATQADLDTRRFVRAATADNPLAAETYGRVLEDAAIAVLVRERQGGTVDHLTSGNPLPYWEVLVPEDALARATTLVDKARLELEASEADAGRAAEEEELATEGLPTGTASSS